MRQIDVAIAIIHRSGKILICQRRKDDIFADLWEFPGGKFETGETSAQCLAREIREELGVSIVIGASLPVIEHVYPQGTIRLFPFLCTLESGEPSAIASQQLKWVGPNELCDYDFPPANGGLIQNVAACFAHDSAICAGERQRLSVDTAAASS